MQLSCIDLENIWATKNFVGTENQLLLQGKVFKFRKKILVGGEDFVLRSPLFSDKN